MSSSPSQGQGWQGMRCSLPDVTAFTENVAPNVGSRVDNKPAPSGAHAGSTQSTPRTKGAQRTAVGPVHAEECAGYRGRRLPR